MFVRTNTRFTPPFGRVYATAGKRLASDARDLARGARICVQRTPRRAHNPIEVIVCYNLCFAGE